MDLQAYAEWLRRRGQQVIRTGSIYWHSEGFRVYQAFPYHALIQPSHAELREIFFRHGAIALRYSAPSESATGLRSYHVVYDSPSYDMDSLGPWARKNVRRGLKNCVVEPVMLPAPHLQYIHFPQRHFAVMSGQFSGLSLYLRVANELLCRFIACSPRIDLTKSRLLTNSVWSSRQILACYGVPADVVYPPVRISESARVAWSKRDLAVIVIGRFHAQKRLHDAIYIVEKLRERFPTLKLHIVGFGRGKYRDYIRKLGASRKGFVSVHENVSHDSLTQLMSTRRFGIHCTPNEHFGMSPAELAASGCLVFVHNSGGQVEIVDGDDELLFNNVDEACRKIADQIENAEIAEKKALGHSQRARIRFASEYFTKQVLNAVHRLTDPPHSSPSRACEGPAPSSGKQIQLGEHRT